jgi:hypothetical protein
MKFSAVMVLLLCIFASFAVAQNAIPLTGKLDLTFVDANGNPLPGATVYYTYVISGTGYTSNQPTTGTGTTDDNGHFATTLTADAGQTIPFRINLTYQGLQVLYDESNTWLDYADKPATLTADIGALTIEVKDSKGRPVANVPVTATGPAGKVDGTTNLQGIMAFAGVQLGADYDVSAKYGDGEASAKGTAPATVELIVPAYDVVIRAVDDAGNKVDAGITVDITALGKKVTGSGEVSMTQLPQGSVQVSARYGTATVDRAIDIGKDGVEEILFDLNAPQIGAITIDPGQPGEQDVVVEAEISDAKGVGISSATLKYTVKGSEQQSVAMNFDGSKYSATIPKQKAKATVDYSIEAVDRNGNKAESQPASYVVKSGIAGKGKAPAGNSTAQQENGGLGIPLGILPIAGLVVLLGIIGFVIMKRRGGNSSPPMPI